MLEVDPKIACGARGRQRRSGVDSVEVIQEEQRLRLHLLQI